MGGKWYVIRDKDGNAITLECDGEPVLHIFTTMLANQRADEIVRLLNDYERIQAENERYRKALRIIAEVDIPYAPMTDHSVMRFYEQVAREALASTQTEPSGAEGDGNA